MPRGVDELRPGEDSRDDEGQVLEVVDERVGGGVVVDARHVPDEDRRPPEAERDERDQEQRQERAQRPEGGERPKHSRRQEEEDERAAHRDDEQRRGGVADQDVLEHVRREQALVARLVERRDERQHEQGQAGGEERGARPGRVLGAAAAEPDERLREEGRSDHGPDQNRRRRLPRRGEMGARHGESG